MTVDVLANDSKGLLPDSVKLIDPQGNPVTELVVEGEGTWTVDPETGKVTFTPEEGFTGNPTPVTYQGTDKNGQTAEAQITITYRDDASVTPAPPETPVGKDNLAETGAAAWVVATAGIGGLLALAGLGAVLVARRRHQA